MSELKKSPISCKMYFCSLLDNFLSVCLVFSGTLIYGVSFAPNIWS